MLSLSSLMKDPPGWFIHVVLITNQFIWSGMHVVAHPALEYFPPLVFSSVRMCIGLPFIALIARKETDFFAALNWRKDIFWMLPLGIIGVALPQWLVFVGNDMAGAGITAAFAPLVPVNTAMMAGLLGLETLNRRIALGIAVAITGTLSILHVEHLNISSDRTNGILVLVFQNWTYASYLVALKYICKRLPYPIGIFFIGSAVGCLFLLVIGAPQLAQVDWASIPSEVWLAELYSGVCASFVAHVMNSWAVHHCSPTIPALYGCLQPVIGVILAFLILKEHFPLRDICSVITIISGLVIVTSKGTNLSNKSMISANSSHALNTATYDTEDALVEIHEVEMKSLAQDDTVGLLSVRSEEDFMREKGILIAGSEDPTTSEKMAREQRLIALVANSTAPKASSRHNAPKNLQENMGAVVQSPLVSRDLTPSRNARQHRNSNTSHLHVSTDDLRSTVSSEDQFYDCQGGGAA